jgi:hypothetical protein
MNDPMGDAPQITRMPAKRKGTRKRRVQTAAKPQPRQQAQASAPVQRGNPRPVPPRAEAARDAARENPRDGAVIALGRDGAHLTRRRVMTGDPLDVPANEIPHGWDYQWNPVTILNKGINEILQGDLQMYQNGWRPVPSARHAGRWTPVGYEGDVVVGGLRLEERPTSLGDEARAEDTAHAKAQLRDRTDALRLTQKSLPGAEVARSRRNAGKINIDFNDRGEDIPRAQHIVEGDAGFEE